MSKRTVGIIGINACGDSRLRGHWSKKPKSFSSWVVHNGLYVQNPEKVDGLIVGDLRCIQRLAQYENLFES